MTARRLLVLASAWDAPARAFAQAADAALATPRDLSREGWTFRLDAPAAATLVAGGEVLRVADIGCVLTRLSGISEADLPHIAEEDRSYVAAEMSAFLLSLLTSLPLRVVNRPAVQCLCGPYASDAGWRRRAASLGLATAPLRQDARLDRMERPEADGATVAVVGGATFGAVDPVQAAAAATLARDAGADLLTVAFDPAARHAVLRASPHVDLQDQAISEAVVDLCAPDRQGAP